MSWHHWVGHFGVFLIVASFLFLQMERMTVRSMAYSACNFFGAAFILVSLHFEFNLSAAIVEGFWMLISAYGLVKKRVVGN